MTHSFSAIPVRIPFPVSSRQRRIVTPPKGCDGFSLAFSVDAASSDFLRERWHIIVPAVPGTSRYVVQQLLELAGLAGVREWLLRPRPETWYSRIRQFQVGNALNPPRICLVEYEVKRWMGSEVKRVIESVVREIPEARTARRVNPHAPIPDATPKRG